MVYRYTVPVGVLRLDWIMSQYHSVIQNIAVSPPVAERYEIVTVLTPALVGKRAMRGGRSAFGRAGEQMTCTPAKDAKVRLDVESELDSMLRGANMHTPSPPKHHGGGGFGPASCATTKRPFMPIFLCISSLDAEMSDGQRSRLAAGMFTEMRRLPWLVLSLRKRLAAVAA